MDPNDAALNAALERLPRRAAPEELKRALEARWAPRPKRAQRWLRSAAAVCAGASLSAVVALAWHEHTASERMFSEAVNDHLRVLYAEQPLEVPSGGVHQVKPWFAGRVDFAPVLGFGGDADYPLQGGAVAYFLDRKAAAFEFKRRLHPITLFVFRAEGLAWPTPSLALGGARGALRTQRGFHVLLFRRDDLGYALVSDLDERELVALASKIAAP